MNTRRSLDKLFHAADFESTSYDKLPDVIFWRFRWLGALELKILKLLQATRLPYYDNCLLAAYRHV
jgi:hypothetical protein